MKKVAISGIMVLLLIIAVLGIGAFLSASLLTPVRILAQVPDTSSSDPRTAPIPELDFDDPSKSMVVRLNFINRTDVEFNSAKVTFERPHTHIGDPPLLRVQIFDDKGHLVDEFNAWHPLWAFQYEEDGSESLIILPNATGQFVFLFQPNLALMKVSDIPLNKEIISVDLKPAIQRFCEENRDDPDCRISAGVPNPQITSPRNTAQFSRGQTITFEGVAQDKEDGELSGSSLQWHSSRDGPLGTGNRISVVLSGPPTPCMPEFIPHTITLTATDSDGNSSTAQIVVSVGIIC
jgi:hypothetical protein